MPIAEYTYLGDNNWVVGDWNLTTSSGANNLYNDNSSYYVQPVVYSPSLQQIWSDWQVQQPTAWEWGNGETVWQTTTIVYDPAAAAKAERAKKRAQLRARKLLRDHLTDQESAQLKADGYFELESSSGRRYRIYRGHSRNIVELDKAGKAVARLCAHLPEAPDEDHMLAQRLWLQTDEAAFRKVANISRIGAVEARQLAGDAFEYDLTTTAERLAVEQRIRDLVREAEGLGAIALAA